MTCPHCHAEIESSQQRYQARQIARGCCPKCGQAKTAVDGPYHVCRPCRLRSNEQRRVTYQRTKSAAA